MRWTPGPDEKTCPAVHPLNSSTSGIEDGVTVIGAHVVPEYDINTAHCHPRRKGVCIACGQMTYSIALNLTEEQALEEGGAVLPLGIFSGFYTMPPEVWSTRGIAEALRTEKQWTQKKYKARQA